jgi:hypothetical protein
MRKTVLDTSLAKRKTDMRVREPKVTDAEALDDIARHVKEYHDAVKKEPWAKQDAADSLVTEVSVVIWGAGYETGEE